ncbi:carboxypeptidase-like regulatory domain-containing protein [Sphingomicrobium flavum]|uniref:carboxypeptidase-like regulatory domain-containing protein n=1 Tax=Sphingomicrobium flavum TaxID=1229164 RepID=UPI0021ADD895|nr:carboxypeptidase-like regulatory domain-containing protein [Sphingomicrobium flavum]
MLRHLARSVMALSALWAASAAAASEDSPVTARWTADPEEQFLLDMRIRDKMLGDGVRAYDTPHGPCVVLGDFLTALDVPMQLDMADQRASGWAFEEANQIVIDRGAGSVSIKSNRKSIATNDIIDVPEGWCVDPAALADWFGLGVRANMAGSVLSLESEAKLPVELAIERRKRAERLSQRASYDMESLPQVKLPYRLWRTPAIDVVVSGGAAYSDRNGSKFDRNVSVYASGEIAKMSFDARLTTSPSANGGLLRMRAYRSDMDGELLGPLGATHFEMGDLVVGATGVGNVSGGGRGAMVTNRPLRRLAQFDLVSFDGELPAGWDAELYRNGQLLGFASPNAQGRYEFNDIALQYGQNDIEIILYGPQGQVRKRVEEVLVGDQLIPPGETWYFASASQPGRELLQFGDSGTNADQVRAQATVALDHGVDKRMSVGMLAQSLLLEDETLTYVEGAVRRTIGNAMVELTAALTDKGGQRYRARAIGRIGEVSLSAQSVISDDFRLTARQSPLVQEHGLSASVPLKLGKRTVPITATTSYRKYEDGSSALSAAGRINVMVDRFNLATELDWERQRFDGLTPARERLAARFVGSGRIGDVRVQGDVDWNVTGGGGVTRAGVNAYWSQSETVDWDAGLVWEPSADRVRARVGHIRKFDFASVALTAEAASDGSVAAGFNMAFSIDAPGGSFRPTSQTLARTGAIEALIFRDDNGNGLRDEGEPLQKGATLTAGQYATEQESGDDGMIRMAGLQGHTPVAVGVDTSMLADPTLVPSDKLRVVTPRPGVTAKLVIPLVGSGEVEGMLLGVSGLPKEGVELQLVDMQGKTVSSTRTAFDGYFLFEKVAYGDYRVRLATASATFLQARLVHDDLVTVSPDKPYLRIGTITLDDARPEIAQAGAVPELALD